jgi:hypothetical protein
MLIVPLLLAACAAAPDGDEPDADERDVSAWAPDLGADDPPPLDAAAAEAALQAILGQVRGMNASPALALFDERMALHDDVCPYEEQVDSAGFGQESVFWYADGCVAASGATFDGYTFARTTSNHRSEDGTSWSGADVKGRLSAVDADGAVFVFGGDAYVETGISADARQTLQRAGMRGAVVWTGAGWDDASFTRDLLAELELTATWAGAPMLAVGGDASGFDGVVPAVVFDGIVAMDAALGSACPTELGGALRARDTAGRWYDLAFDGGSTPDAAVDDAACDGCGAWSLDGEPLGDVCLDPTALLGWEGTAW